MDEENLGATPAVTPADGAGTTPERSESSTEHGEKSLLSVVRDVVADRGDKSTAASPAEHESEAPEVADGQQEKTDGEGEKPDDYSDAPFHKHPRFRELIAERNEYREDATRYRNVEQFLRTHQMSADEAAEILTIGGLLKSDPMAALERIKPVFLNLLRVTGEIIPADLQEKVRAGQITPEMAKEFSRVKAQQQVESLRREADARRQAEEAAVREVEAVQAEVMTWEAEKRRTDPHFDAKSQTIQLHVAAWRGQGGVSRTPAEARAVLEQVYKTVNAQFTPPATPADRPPRKPLTGGSVPAGAAPTPRSTLDVIRQVRGG